MTLRTHGPENAEFELRKAYSVVCDGAVPYFWDRPSDLGVDFKEALEMYKHAYKSFRKGNKLAAERWARAAKHLSRAFASEAKISFLEAHRNDLPFLVADSPEGQNPHERSDTTADLLNSVAQHVPVGFEQMPKPMSHYLVRAREHLKIVADPQYTHELMRAARIHAAYEYGRTLEILALAYEAESTEQKSA